MGCRFLLQGILQNQGSNLGLLHCKQTLYRLSHLGSPFTLFLSLMSISSIQFSSVTQSCPTLINSIPSRFLEGIKTNYIIPGGLDGKESTCNAGELGLIPRLGKSPGGEHGNPLQYSCLENPHRQKSLEGYNSRGCKESDMTKQQHTTHKIPT